MPNVESTERPGAEPALAPGPARIPARRLPWAGLGDPLRDPLATDPVGDPLDGGPSRRAPQVDNVGEITKLPKVGAALGAGRAVGHFADAEGRTGVDDMGLSNVSSPTMAGVAGLLSLGDGVNKIRKGGQRVDEAGADDVAGTTIGQELQGEGKLSVAKGAVSMGKSATESAAMVEAGTGNIRALAGGVGTTAQALSTAAAGVSLVGGVIGVGQSAYEGMRAAHSYSKAASATPLTADGAAWLARVKERQKTKGAVQALKFAAAAVGIVGGALLLASNPVGWAIGLASAAVGVGFVVGKMGYKAKQAVDRMKAERGRTAGGLVQDALTDQDFAVEVGFRVDAERVQAGDPAVVGAEAEAVREDAESIERSLSENYRIAGDVQEALWADPDPRGAVDDRASEARRRGHDAALVIRALGVSYEAAISPSGAELIARKLSALDGL